MADERVPWRVRLTRSAMRTICRGVFHALSPVKILGRENVPLGSPYIAATNHISIFDPPFAASFWPEALEIIGASDVFDKPGQGQLLRLYGVTPVHRGDYDRAVIEWVLRVIRSGKPLLIAPEGGRTHVTAMRRAKPGIAYIVEKTRVPVIPVGLVGTTDDYWRRAMRGERPPLEMRIGKPFHLPAVEQGAARQETRQHNADLVMSHIAGLLPEEYRGVYAESAVAPS
ncbi:MAG: hypothetical protein HFACDABA_00951 [Anaerolineales bacterium]|nr:hypothetical protein [Anaerolineales bacterium]